MGWRRRRQRAWSARSRRDIGQARSQCLHASVEYAIVIMHCLVISSLIQFGLLSFEKGIKMRTRRSINMVLTAAAFSALVLLMPSVAAAHNMSVAGPTACGWLDVQACGHGGVQQSHTHIYSCDDDADGYMYFIAYTLKSGKFGQVFDGNGSKSGCGGKTVGSSSNPIRRFKGCSAGKVGGANLCTAWLDA